jgi:hypothetical protein
MASSLKSKANAFWLPSPLLNVDPSGESQGTYQLELTLDRQNWVSPSTSCLTSSPVSLPASSSTDATFTRLSLERTARSLACGWRRGRTKVQAEQGQAKGLAISIRGYSDGMTTGSSIFLIAVGAILRYAVTATVSGISLQTVGLIFIIAGILGLVLSLFYMLAWKPRRGQVVRDRVIERDPYEEPPVRP